MILCADPDRDALEATRDALSDVGFDTRGAESIAEARDVLEETDDVDGLVTEHDFADGTGVRLVRQTREVMPDTFCLLYTDASFEEIDTGAVGDVVADYLSKDDPDARAELARRIEQGVTMRSQTAYPLPENETARIEALERYAAEPGALSASFDRLTELAVELFEVDSSAVGLIDEHEEHFLSCHGVSLGSIDREDTICTYAILDNDVTVIEDVQDDPRFSDDEGLATAGIRFYASAPLVTPDGHAIGTFCIYRAEPRSFSDRDRELLELLAEEAMERLELRRRREAERGATNE